MSYETVMEAQRAITEINKYKGWKAEKYISGKDTRIGNQFKERPNASSTKIETIKNDREKTNQTGLKNERTCSTFGTKDTK